MIIIDHNFNNKAEKFAFYLALAVIFFAVILILVVNAAAGGTSHTCIGKVCEIRLNDVKYIEIEEIKNTDQCLVDCETILRIRPVNVPLNIPSSPNANFRFDFAPDISGTITYEQLVNTSVQVNNYSQVCVPFIEIVNGSNWTNPNCTSINNPYSTLKEVWQPFNYYGASFAADTNYYIKIKGKITPRSSVHHSGTWLGENVPELSWWNSNFLNAMNISVNLTGSTIYMNMALPFNITYNTNMSANFSDLRFTNASGNQSLDYWIEKQVNSSWAYVWVEANYTGSEYNITMYYNNSAAMDASNGTNTFLIFDEFNGAALDTSIWATSGIGTTTVANGVANISSVSASHYGIQSVVNFSRPIYAQWDVDYMYDRINGNNNGIVLLNGSVFMGAGRRMIWQDWYGVLWRIYREDDIVGSGGITDYARTDAVTNPHKSNLIMKLNASNYSMWEYNTSSGITTNLITNATFQLNNSTITQYRIGTDLYGDASGATQLHLNRTFTTNWTGYPEPTYGFFKQIDYGSTVVVLVNANSPANNTFMSNSTPNFWFNATNGTAPYRCNLTINGTNYGFNTSVTENNQTNITANTSLSDGFYQWYINCTDANNNNAVSYNRNFTRDNTNPTANNTLNATDIYIGRDLFTVTSNFSDLTINNVTVYLYYPNGTQYKNASNNSNWTFTWDVDSSMPTGNYTINITINDSAGNIASNKTWIGVGKINQTNAAVLTAINFTSRTLAWGSASGLDNNTKTNITTRLEITLAADGILTNKTRSVSINFTKIWGNWTNYTLTNYSGSTPASTLSTDNLTWTSDAMSSSGSTYHYVNVTSDLSLNYTRNDVSTTTSDFLISSGLNASYNVYARINLPVAMNFDKSQYHPRYYVCTGTITRATLDCSAFSTAVDVTSTNQGSNSASSAGSYYYPVNLYVHDDTETITDLTFQTNQSDFLIRVIKTSGGFTTSGGTGTPTGGGGGGVEEIIQYVNATLAAAQNICPEGYTLTLDGSQCIRSLEGTPFDALFKPFLFGMLTPFHMIVLIIVVLLIQGNRSMKRRLKRGIS